MVLSRPDILRYLEAGTLRFDPEIAPTQVAQVSVDLRLDRKFITFREPPAYLPAIHVDRSLWESRDLWEEEERDAFRLQPGQLVLARRWSGFTSRAIWSACSKGGAALRAWA